jgi:hypothetical protein
VKIGQSVSKNQIDVFDALPWEGAKTKMEDLPIHPSLAETWRCLFDKDNQTPLQKLMVTVYAGNLIGKEKK